MNWQAANQGVAQGMPSRYYHPLLWLKVRQIHAAIGAQRNLYHDFRHFSETRCDLPMSEMLEETKLEWRKPTSTANQQASGEA